MHTHGSSRAFSSVLEYMHRTAVIRCALFHSQRILFNSPNAIKFSSIYTPQLPIYTFYIYICNPPTMSFYYM